MNIKEFAKKSIRKKKSEVVSDKADSKSGVDASKSGVNAPKAGTSSSKYIPPGSGTDFSEISNVSETGNA